MMNAERSLWKKFFLIALTAFLIGLIPYFWLAISKSSAGIPLGEYIARMFLLTKNFIVRYLPHILTAYVIFVAALIFFEGQNPDRTILWLFTLVFLPVIGIIIYAILGPDLKRLKVRKHFRPMKRYPPVGSLDWKRAPARVRKASVLAFRSSASDIYEQCELEILVDGVEKFPKLIAALKSARRFINIEYFIFRDDRLGAEIADILMAKAQSGVKVRMLVDGVGSWHLKNKLIHTMKRAGVDFHTFMPVSFPFFHSSINFRNHRKIVIVDGDVALMGGLNVGVEYLGEGKLGNWRDTHALFRGGPVKALNAVFLDDWKVSTSEALSPDDEQFAPTDPDAVCCMPFIPTQIVASGSNSAWHSIQQMYFLMITEAQRRIWITSPYLVPDMAIVNALQTAALSGVDVRILMPSKADHFLSHWAGRSNVEGLLRSGVRIYMYQNGFVHAKTMLMDEAICSVGTTNLDNRSLEINFEVQAFIYDETICDEFAGQFLRDCADSTECNLSEWEKRPLKARALESVGRLWSAQI